MLISVILPVYNQQPFLAAAIESVIAQTCSDFECIIINNGSTDDSAAIANQYAKQDSRIRVVHVPEGGLVAALNHGIEIARGTYLARMDADDISMPERFSRQAGFLESHPDIAICGTFAQSFGDSTPQLIKHPADPDFIFASLIFRCPLIHPTVMLRRTIQPHYDASFRHCEDYELWARLALQHRFANIPEPLLQYRVHAGQVSLQHQDVQRGLADRVWQFLLSQLCIVPTESQQATHRALAFDRLESTREFLGASDDWLRTLLAANTTRRIFPQRAFAITLALRWLAACDAAQSLPHISSTFKASPLFNHLDLTSRSIPWL